MIHASDLFADSLRYSHHAMSRVTVLAPLTGGGYGEVDTFAVSAGSLRIDGTSTVWRSTSGLAIIPTDATARAVLGDIDETCRLRIERGIEFPTNEQEWVQIAYLQVKDADTDHIGAVARINASDLGCLVEDYPLITPYSPAGMTTVAAIQDLVGIADSWDPSPWVIHAGIDTEATPDVSVVFTGSRWDAVKTLAQSIAAVVHYGADGTWHIRPATVNVDEPVAVFASGPGGVLVGFDRKRSRSDQHNAIVLPWDSPNAGGTVFVVDNDPTSPTYWDGPFGRKPLAVESNPAITTEAQAIDAAWARLSREKGRSSQIDFRAVHDPRIEPMDPVRVTSRGLDQVLVIDTIPSYPLVGGQMTATTRLVREVVA